eukprot:9870380-Alexandrium_andersonii.AAC.1
MGLLAPGPGIADRSPTRVRTLRTPVASGPTARNPTPGSVVVPELSCRPPGELSTEPTSEPCGFVQNPSL